MPDTITETTDTENTDVEDIGIDVDKALAERDAEREAEAGQGIDPADLAAPATAFVPLRERGRQGRVRVDPYAVARLTERPAWHSVGAPESVRQAWAAVTGAADVLESAIDKLQQVEVDKVSERAEYMAEVAAQAEADPEGSQPTPTMHGGTDWDAESLARSTRHQVAHRQLVTARQEYDEATRDALPAWRADLIAAIQPARSEARRATQEADAAVRSAMATVQAARAVDEAIEPKPGWHKTTRAGLARRAVEGLAAALSYVQSDDPVVTGRYLVTGDDMSPPSWTRAVLAESASEADWWLLGAIEAVDDFRSTSYTEPGQRHHFGEVASPELRERLRRRDLSADSI